MGKRSALVRRIVDGVSFLIVIAAALILGVRAFADRMKHQTVDDGSLGLTAFSEIAHTGQRIGPEGAQVSILVYSSYTCGFCAELHASLEELLRRYPQHLAVVIKHFEPPSFQPRFNVPLGAQCAAEQGRFREYHAVAFENGRMLDYSDGWRMLADSASVPDLDAFTVCVSSRRYGDRVEGDYEEGRSLGVRVTPTLFVNGQVMVGTPPLAVLDSMVAGQFRDRGPNAAGPDR